MYHEVKELRDFYYRSVLGRSVKARLQSACRNLWPDVKGEIVVGYGFAPPVMRPFVNEASHMACLMPAEQGVLAWPPGEQNISALCGEHSWPLGASSADRIVLLHALENAHQADALLNEVWRVLAPEGRVILIFANRLGIWSTNENTPFGFGRPFGMAQLERVLHSHQFEITKREGALYGSPWKSNLGAKFSNMMEWVGERAHGRFLAGVWVIEIKKHSFIQGKMIKRREPIFLSPDLRPAGAVRKAH